MKERQALSNVPGISTYNLAELVHSSFSRVDEQGVRCPGAHPAPGAHLLDGVRVPTATALLAVVLPDRHTILDMRSTKALVRLGRWDETGGYRAYVDVCRRLAEDAGVDLRTLDRSLWQWSKAEYPA